MLFKSKINKIIKKQTQKAGDYATQIQIGSISLYPSANEKSNFGDNRFCTNLSYRDEKKFTGREQILEKIKDKFMVHESVTQVIDGLGGVGKTEIAKYYAHINSNKYSCIWWINAETEGTTLLAYEEFDLEKNLILPYNKKNINADEIRNIVKNWLHIHDNWLFIYDNVDEDSELHNFLPNQVTGKVQHILITTRNTQLASYRGISAIPVSIDVFTPNESTEFLQKHTMLTIDKYTDELAFELGYLPLALEHAGSFISNNKTYSYKDYLEEYKKDKIKLLRNSVLNPSLKNKADPVYLTWNISIKKIGKKTSSARQLFILCAFFAADDILDKWFKDAANKLPIPLRNCVKNKLEFDKAKAKLSKYSLVKIEKNDDEIIKLSMHRVLQAVVTDSLAGKYKKWRHYCAKILGEQINDKTVDNFLNKKNMTQHVEVVVKNFKKINKNIIGLYYFLGVIYDEFSKYSEALNCFHIILNYKQNMIIKDKEGIAEIYNKIGITYEHQSDYSDALKYQDKSLEIYEKVGDKFNLIKAKIFLDKGLCFCQLGKYEDAMALFEKVLQFQETQGIKNNMEIAITCSRIGFVWYYKKEFTNSLKWFLKALILLGSDNLYAAKVYHNIALVYQELKRYGKALNWLKKSLKIRKNTFGDLHRDVAAIYQSIAEIHEKMGKNKEAMDLCEKALHIKSILLADGHDSFAFTYSTIGTIHENLGENQKAFDFFKRAREIWLEKRGKEHQYFKVVQDNINRINKKMSFGNSQ